jgi:hypothetical protein
MRLNVATRGRRHATGCGRGHEEPRYCHVNIGEERLDTHPVKLKSRPPSASVDHVRSIRRIGRHIGEDGGGNSQSNRHRNGIGKSTGDCHGASLISPAAPAIAKRYRSPRGRRASQMLRRMKPRRTLLRLSWRRTPIYAPARVATLASAAASEAALQEKHQAVALAIGRRTRVMSAMVPLQTILYHRRHRREWVSTTRPRGAFAFRLSVGRTSPSRTSPSRHAMRSGEGNDSIVGRIGAVASPPPDCRRFRRD